MNPTPSWTSSLATHVGLVRSNNQDALAEDPALRLLILADGMGGHRCGEVASGLAASTVLDSVRELCGSRQSPPEKTRILEIALQIAHERIQETAARRPECQGMGTTLIACIADGDSLAIAHVGDSRLYRVRAGRMQQLTRDHSLLQELIDQQHYSREQAMRRVRHNRLTRALGIDQELKIDLMESPLENGDLLLLCSDGLSDMLEDREIERLLDAGRDLESLSRKLVEAALQAGGIDNISVVLARFATAPEAEASVGRWQRLKRLLRS